MKGEPEKAPNHERWVISYADFVTLLLATFVVMYAVSTINSSKFQQMAESFSTAFIGRTTNVQDTGFAAAQRAPFTAMPNPVHLPIITREVQVKNLPPALRQDPTSGEPTDNPGQDTQNQSQTAPLGQEQPQEGLNAPDAELRQKVERRVQGLDAAYEQLTKALAALIGKGQVQVSLQSLGVVIDINEVLLFNSGKSDLVPTALTLVDRIAKILVDLHYQIQVNGFTDNVPIHNPQFDSNWDLSATRAISVVKRFVAAGIDPTLLVGAGFGQYHPVATNDTVEGKATNRRVSIVVVSPIEGSDPERMRLLGSTVDRAAPAKAPSAVTPAAAPVQ
jgi:chemotaxis protein MotB